MAMPPPPPSSLEGEDGHGEEQAPGSSVGSSQLVMPEDGYEWKKYGQKYIRKIRKNRSYFKCRDRNCNVKKRVEWPPSDPSSMRIVYDGRHDHPARRTSTEQVASSSTSVPNPYDLATQVFGRQSEPS